jgi:hypothetical protein
MRVRATVAATALAIAALLPCPVLAQDAAEGAGEPQDLNAPAGMIANATPTPGYVTGAGWRVDLSGTARTPATVLTLPATLPALVQDPPAPRPRPVAFEYSDAYHTRRKIHVYASLAMVPLFVTQYALGDSLYTNATEDKRTAHIVVGSGIGTLFAINTVTGVWNLWEGRKNPSHRARRLTHGIMMLGADAGFLATAMLAPGDDGSGNKSTHRAVALTSMGVAVASYVFMLLTR